MKIQIDLNEILGDETGVETLQESVRRQVTDALVRATKQGVDATIKQEVTATIKNTLESELIERMPIIVNDVLTAEYTPVTRYGETAKPTSFRAELIKTIHEQMVYKRTTYDSDKNAFTKAVDAVVGENVAEFKKEFQKLVTAQFVADAMAFATAEMSKRLGLSK